MRTLYFWLGIICMLSWPTHAQDTERRSTIWNGTHWSSGLPDSETDAVIAADLTTNEDLEVYNLTVISGAKLTLLGSSRLHLYNDGIVAPDGKLIIDDDAQFLQKKSTALTPTISIYRKTGFILKYDYTYFCSPVSGQVAKYITDTSFFGGNLDAGYDNTGNPGGTFLYPLFDKYFTWNPAGTPVGTDSNIYSAGAWQNISETSVMENDGKGYIVRAPNSFPTTSPTQQWRVCFTGTPNAGTITRAINGTAYTPYAGAQTALPSPLTLPYKTCNDGLYNMNLIGNPYPSMLDADTFLTNPANVSAIDGAIYMWSHNSGPSAANPGNGTQIYNYTASDYVIYNLVGGVGTGRVTGDPVYAPDDSNRPIGKIAVCQGFFVRGITNGAGVATRGIFF